MSTTVLPSLPLVGGCVTQQVLKTIVSPADTKHAKKLNVIKKVTYRGGKVTSPLSANQKHAEQVDVTSYRNSFFHNLCTDVLEEGYHLAFRELFNLVREAQALTAADENASHKKQQIPPEENEEKLTYLKEMLVKVEVLKRQGRTEQIYDTQLALATYFDQHKDFFMSDHFYTSAHQTSRQIRADGGRKEAEANCNLGKAAERKKDYQQAIKLYEKFYSLSKDKSWKIADQDEMLLGSVACQHLLTAHVAYSNQIDSEREEEVLEHLHHAHQLAKEGGDNQEIGRIGYLIGNKYDFYGDQDSAVKYHAEYYELCKCTSNETGMGKACQALAVANKRQGSYKEAIDNLKQFLKVTEENGDNESRRHACSDIGSVYNMMGKYEQASNYYKRAYELAHQRVEASATTTSIPTTASSTALAAEHDAQFSSCEYAISLAHGLLTGEAEQVTFNNKKSLHSLLHWKSDRLQSFSKDNTTFSMFQTLENRQEEERKLQERRKSRQLDKTNLSQFKQPTAADDADGAGSDTGSVPQTPSTLIETEEELSKTNSYDNVV